VSPSDADPKSPAVLTENNESASTLSSVTSVLEPVLPTASASIPFGSYEHNSISENFDKLFGAQLMEPSENVQVAFVEEWSNRWCKVINFQRKQYDLPGGAVGRHFVDCLADEVDKLTKGIMLSDRLLVFCAVVLQRDSSVRKACDIRRILTRRLSLWTDNQYDVLLQEAVRCDRQLCKGPTVTKKPPNTDHIETIFTKLMLQGKVRDAIRWVTERSTGGVLNPSSVIVSGDEQKTVLEILKEKHPYPKEPGSDILMEITSEGIPLMVDLDITSSHVETVARRLQEDVIQLNGKNFFLDMELTVLVFATM
jgi:hypothetical protein